jgi:hypothetical protein
VQGNLPHSPPALGRSGVSLYDSGMLTRLYVDNYRCLVRFECRFGARQLVLGLDKCGIPARIRRPLNASREVHGGNVEWVIKRFPTGLHACRQRHRSRANTLLIAVVDADDFTVAERRSQFGLVHGSDPVVLLIPKRHIETWIRAALGADANEADDYKRPEPKPQECRQAAQVIHGWARNSAQPGPTCVPSL